MIVSGRRSAGVLSGGVRRLRDIAVLLLPIVAGGLGAWIVDARTGEGAVAAGGAAALMGSAGFLLIGWEGDQYERYLRYESQARHPGISRA